MISEQTFNVTITVSDPTGGVLPAILQSTDPGASFDYSLGEAGVTTAFAFFPPDASSVAFSFELNGDGLTEGIEAFLATSSQTPGFPTFNAPNISFSVAEIRIIDDDSE